MNESTNFLSYFVKGVALATAISIAVCSCSKIETLEQKIGKIKSWKVENQGDSQGIKKARITSKNPYEGKGSLELNLDIDENSETHRQGEAYIDLRYMPKENPLGTMDLAGKTITAKVYCEKGTSGSNSAPGGVQICLKSVDGKEVWSNYYSNWQNIWQKEQNADKELGDVREGEWSTIKFKIPENGEKPKYGVCDPEFDPKNIALIGIKYGLNDKYNGPSNGNVFVDDVKIDGKPLFNFERT